MTARLVGVVAVTWLVAMLVAATMDPFASGPVLTAVAAAGAAAVFTVVHRYDKKEAGQ